MKLEVPGIDFKGFICVNGLPFIQAVFVLVPVVVICPIGLVICPIGGFGVVNDVVILNSICFT
jgi:hypothetical protein